MMISVRPPLPLETGIKTEPEEEGIEDDGFKAPSIDSEEFSCCAGCKAPFKTLDGEQEHEHSQRRGQVGTINGKKVQEFYSYNSVTGESILAVFELRMAKSATGLKLQEMNENLGFCQACATLMSQLYKLHQEVLGLVKEGSIIEKLTQFENSFADNQETNFFNPKKRKRKVFENGMKNGNSRTTKEDQDEGMDMDDDEWAAPDDNGWNDDYGQDVGADVTATVIEEYDNGDGDAATLSSRTEKRKIQNSTKKTPKVGIKITSVESTRTILADEFVSDNDDGSGRSRRRSAKAVDYKKVMKGSPIDDVDDDDDEWVEPPRKSSKVTARKKTGGDTSNSKGRGRPPGKGKNSSAASNSSKAKAIAQKMTNSAKSPAGKSLEANCRICQKIFPSSYLAEHMNVAHSAISGQPCLICGKFFDDSYKAIKHLLTHVPEKAFGCSRCHDTFKTVDERNQHTSSHIDSDKLLECPKCSQTFQSLLYLNKHEAQKHRTTKSFLCSICAKLLSGKDEWIQHILSHGPFQCYYCKEFLKPGEYKRHIQTTHLGVANRPKPSTSTTNVIAEVILD